MKVLSIIIFSIFLQSCSFDNKSGIWKNENYTGKKDKNYLEGFETLSSLDQSFNEIISIKKNFKFNLIEEVENFEWKDQFSNSTNNYYNYKYKEQNNLILKSKKFTKHQLGNFILFENNHLIANDKKGNLIIFSLNTNKIIQKFNFYKKKYKSFKKNLNLITENNIIYVSDNFGYLYAFSIKKSKLLWAKNFKIPFRSNLKILNDKIILANQNNDLYFVNKKNGDLIKQIPTEENIIKNEFVNNISLNEDFILFLNTYGSLYSIDKKNLRINWFLNLNRSLDLNPSNLFLGNQIINNSNKIVVTSNKYLYVIDSLSGSINFRKNFSSFIKPTMTTDYIFLITKNNLLVSINSKNGKIIYSYDINQKISEFLNVKKKRVEYKDLMIINSKIFIFLKNSYILKFDLNGELLETKKLPTRIKTYPIIIDGSILYLDKNNKLSVLN